MYQPEYTRLSVPKRHIDYDCGAGTLQSYYETGVESEGSKKLRYDTNEHARGPLPLFPQLDVMAGDASAINDAVVHSWNWTKPPGHGIDVAVLNFEEMLGGLHGYRIHNDTGFEEDEINQYKQSMHEDLYTFSNANLDAHSGQGPAGRHIIDSSIAEESAKVALQHNVGDAQEARDAGLERSENAAINAQETGKGETYENQDTLDTSAPTTVPMDIDAIQVNGIVTHPEDTDIALGGNQTF